MFGVFVKHTITPEGFLVLSRCVCLALPMGGWLIEKPGRQLLVEFKKRGVGSDVDWEAFSHFRSKVMN